MNAKKAKKLRKMAVILTIGKPVTEMVKVYKRLKTVSKEVKK